MMQFKKYSLVMAGVLTLSACSFMSPVKIEPETGYVINSIPDHMARARHRSQTLLVMTPETNPAYNSSRIAFTMHPYQVSYYSKSRWLGTPAEMLMPLIQQTMLNTHRFKSVISPPFAGQYQYALRTQIRMLEVDYTREMPSLLLTMGAQIIKASNGNVVAQREFKEVVPLDHHSPYGAVVAANRAASTFLKDLAAWCLRHTR